MLSAYGAALSSLRIAIDMARYTLPKVHIRVGRVFKGIGFTNTEHTPRDPWCFGDCKQLPPWLDNLIICPHQIQLSPFANDQQTTSPPSTSLFDHTTNNDSGSQPENTIPILDSALPAPASLPDTTLPAQGDDDSGKRPSVVPTDHSGATSNTAPSKNPHIDTSVESV